MLVAMLVGLFFIFAGLSACLAIVFTFVGLWLLLAKPKRLLGLYVLGSGFLGAIAAILFGELQRWNIVGEMIFAEPRRGYMAWAAIGFGWSSAAAFVVGSIVRWMRIVTSNSLPPAGVRESESGKKIG